MVAAEFFIDLSELYRDVDFASSAGRTELDLIQKLDESIQIFKDLKYEGLVARAYKFKGILFYLIYA
jgi:hypothetical protein